MKRLSKRIRTAQPLILSAAFLLCFVFLRSDAAQAESTITCPSGTYDMLDWMTMDSDLRSQYHMEGTSNPLYTIVQQSIGQSGKFYWIKGGLGYPWDIQLYDANYIYLWITELSWTVPQSYKKFTNNKNLPLVPRCATAGFPGSTIKVANTNYDLHTNCSNTCSVTLGLLNAINQVWGPYSMSFGGNLANQPLTTLVISYRYNCNANYANCGDKEEYYLTQKYGLVQWIHYIRIPATGAYAQLQKTIFNKLVPGVVTPNFPCF
ncbi:MAG: hypothetical protein DMG88_00845 [Acidobacteria bacterium]|nr:MAG: hypothetical protein DMG88_00845 [Acidobacteriota bacterium]